MNPYESTYLSKKAEYDRVKSIVATASKKTLTPEQSSALLASKNNLIKLEKDYLDAKKQYDTYWVDPSKVNTIVTPDTAKNTWAVTSETYAAPNGKSYTIKKWLNKVWFVGVDGTNKEFTDVASAKATIDSGNPKTEVQQVQESVATAKDNLWTAVTDVKTELEDNKNVDINARQTVLDKIQDIDTKKTLQNNLDTIQTGFTNAASYLNSASELESEAQRIYGQDQIDAQTQALIKKWFDPAKAQQAALYMNLKWRAGISQKVATIKADYEKTLANLETQKAQLVTTANNQWLENDKRVSDQLKAIETQVQNIKNNYQTNVLNVASTYQLKPLVDVNSSNLAAEAQTVAQSIQNQYDTSTPQRKVAALAKVFGDSFMYIDWSIYNYMSLPFDQLITQGAAIIQKNMKKMK